MLLSDSYPGKNPSLYVSTTFASLVIYGMLTRVVDQKS